MIDFTHAVWRKSSKSDTGPRQCVEVAAVWRKSSRSNTGAGNCVEVAAGWRKSSKSDTRPSYCVEVVGTDRAVAVRDSKNPDGGVLAFARAGWAAFARGTKAGIFDR